MIPLSKTNLLDIILLSTQGFLYQNQQIAYLLKKFHHVSHLIIFYFNHCIVTCLFHINIKLQPTGGIIINIECKAWARNIHYDRKERIGSVHFELMID